MNLADPDFIEHHSTALLEYISAGRGFGGGGATDSISTDMEFKSTDMALGMEGLHGAQSCRYNAMDESVLMPPATNAAGNQTKKQGLERRAAARRDTLVLSMQRPETSLVLLHDVPATVAMMLLNEKAGEEEIRVAMSYSVAPAGACIGDLKEQRAFLREKRALAAPLAVLAAQATAAALPGSNQNFRKLSK